ncbi:MAG: trypsin-like peptidase domain-containing protein [Gemmatimonadota bacterium]|nr:trypsin-like peptidase domain-containing protein [Gemmatimonadota bacterium]
MMKIRIRSLVALSVLACAGCHGADNTVDQEPDRGSAFAAEAGLAQSGVARAPRSARGVSDSVDVSRRTAIVRAANRVAPAVVSINVMRTQRVQPRSAWESFFLPPGAQRRSTGFGSGVIVRVDGAEGIVLTNDHVIRDASRIQVSLPDGRDFEAELVGTDPVADVAVLRIEGADLPVAPVSSVEDVMIGEWALAIGNPLGNYATDAEPTVTAGVISAVDRNIVPSSDSRGFYFGMIQTDASVNPGNSGGPLVNALGEIIGINASIISRSGGSEGLGFAIPIDRALQIADDLTRYGEIRRAWVGVDVEPVDADVWGRTRGVRISRVAPDSPADDAGLEVGDRLLRGNDRALTGPLDFEGLVLDLRAEDRLVLEVEGRSEPVRLVAAPFPSVTAERVRVLSDIELITVTPQIQVERNLTSADGALVTEIPSELQSQLGLRPGDVIVQVNRTRIRSAEDAARAFEAVRGSGRIALYFERNGDYNMRNFYWSG